MNRSRATARFIFALFLSVIGLATRILAHDLMASYTIARLTPETIDLTIKIAGDSAWPVVQDTVAPGALFIREEFETTGKQTLIEFAKILDDVSIDGKPIKPTQIDVALEEDNFFFKLRYARPAHGMLRLRENYLKHMSLGYTSHITVLSETDSQLASKILESHDSAFAIALPERGVVNTAPSSSPTFSSFFRLGVEHILTGYDHLLFLCGLLVACRRLSTMFAIITCFTLAHSLTLGLAAMNIVEIPSRIVEPLIAASIVYVGVENLIRQEEPKGRWALTFFFGLIHGFGFATALREMGLGAGGASILKPLFSFNLGVEFGQISVTLLLLPALWLIRRSASGARLIRPALSAVVIVLGGYWLLQRTVLPSLTTAQNKTEKTPMAAAPAVPVVAPTAAGSTTLSPKIHAPLGAPHVLAIDETSRLIALHPSDRIAYVTAELQRSITRGSDAAVLEAVRFCELDPSYSLEYGRALLSILGDVGDYPAALRFVLAEESDGDLGENGNKWLNALFLRWGEVAPGQAVQSVDTLVTPGLRGEARQALAAGWVKLDPSAAAEYAWQRPASPDRNDLLEVVRDSWRESNPRAATAWFAQHVPPPKS